MTASVKGDGNCFYRAVFIALALEGKCFYGDNHHEKLRRATVKQALTETDKVYAHDASGSASKWVTEMQTTGRYADLLSVRKCAELLGICIRVHVGDDMADEVRMTDEKRIALIANSEEKVKTVYEFEKTNTYRAAINLLLASNHYSVIVDDEPYARTCAQHYCADTSTGDFAEELHVWQAIAGMGRTVFGSPNAAKPPCNDTSSDEMIAKALSELLSSSDVAIAKLLSAEYANVEGRIRSDSDYAFNLQVSMLG